jgi:hypothetical protein
MKPIILIYYVVGQQNDKLGSYSVLILPVFVLIHLQTQILLSEGNVQGDHKNNS